MEMRDSGFLRFRGWVLLIVFTALWISCKKSGPVDPGFQPTPYEFGIPFRFPDQLRIPADNPTTVEGVELGRRLFYDGRVSGRSDPDSMMSCATCHLQSRSFECGIDHPLFTGGHPHGATGIPTPHYMMPLINLLWTPSGYLWNGSVAEIEAFTWMAIVAPHEMNSDTNRAKTLISQTPGYPEMFRKAFGSNQVTVRNMGRAIAQFVRTLISADSKFDRYLRGEVQLSPSERNGYVLFMTEEGADCFHCHGGEGNPLFTTGLFYNNGKDTVFSDTRDRYMVTGDPADHGAYKAPTLRNIIFTAPYMHDGRYKTLDQVLEFYNTGVLMGPCTHPLMHHAPEGGVLLSPAELSDLKAFLLTLTDSSFLTNPKFGPPEQDIITK